MKPKLANTTKSAQQQSFSGKVSRITYFNPNNNYTVARLKTIEPTVVTLVGNLPELKAGQQINVWGVVRTHPKYGKFLAVEGLETKTPTDIDGMQAYLASDLIKGIGQALAKKVIQKFGKKTLEILENDPGKLAGIRGITKERAQKIGRAWVTQRKLQQTMITLQGLGLSLNLSQKILGFYQDKSVAIVKENPYQLNRDLIGVGFATADNIAKKVGIQNNNPHRIQAGVEHVLEEAQSHGHSFLPQARLIKDALFLLEKDDVKNRAIYPKLIRQAIQNLCEEKRLVTEKPGDVYLKFLHMAEKETAKLLKSLMKPPKASAISQKKADYQKAFEKFIKIHKFTPELQQKNAVINALSHPVSIMSGGPGTGKSTAVLMLTEILQSLGISFVLCAPTGRAAKRLTELTSQKASTIHRLLKIRPGQAPKHNKLNPLPQDFIVVDEISMLDLQLFYQLLLAIKPGTHLLLVGDANQLPSVGPGNVLKDLIAAKTIPTIFLSIIFRQAEKSQIIKNAHRINQGLFPVFTEHPTDFYLFQENEPSNAAEVILNLVSQKIPREFGISAHKVQVLTPIYRGAAGVANLNELLQARVNSSNNKTSELLIGNKVWRVNDKVIQLVNNYDKEVFNGDMGIIKSVREKELVVDFEGNSVRYKNSEIDQLMHAFAITIHKSQGSEFEAVVMPILTAHFIMLERKLLYTAITRAKKLLVLVGSKKALFLAIKNNRPEKRYTNLVRRLTTSSPQTGFRKKMITQNATRLNI